MNCKRLSGKTDQENRVLILIMLAGTVYFHVALTFFSLYELNFCFLTDFAFSSWKTQNKYTAMENHSIARLEEELGMHSYLYNSSQVCDRTSGIFTSSSNGWTNGRFCNSLSVFMLLFILINKTF